MKAFILAAGKGTRLRPFTNSHPKALAEVNQKTLLQRNIQFLQSFGINDFVINIHHFGDQILDFLDKNKNFGANIEVSDERESLLETGGALLKAKELFVHEEDFLLMNADILTNLDILELISFHLDNNNFVTLAVSDRISTRKLLFNKDMMLKGWRNENAGEEILVNPQEHLTPLAFSGIHCLSTKIFSKIKRIGKFSIIDEYLDLMIDQNIRGYKHDALLIDVGKPESIERAEEYFK